MGRSDSHTQQRALAHHLRQEEGGEDRGGPSRWGARHRQEGGGEGGTEVLRHRLEAGRRGAPARYPHLICPAAGRHVWLNPTRPPPPPTPPSRATASAAGRCGSCSSSRGRSSCAVPPAPPPGPPSITTARSPSPSAPTGRRPT